jgi:hypothetical protein
MLHIGRKGRHLGLALAHQLRVDHHRLDVHIGEQAIIAIPRLDIELQVHRRPCNRAAVGSLGFGAEGFNPLLRSRVTPVYLFDPPDMTRRLSPTGPSPLVEHMASPLHGATGARPCRAHSGSSRHRDR